MNPQSTERCLLEKIIAILLFCYFVLFPFGQLGRVPASAVGRLVGYHSPPRSHGFLRQLADSACHLGGVLRQFLTSPEIHLYMTDIILFLLLGIWGAWVILGVLVGKRKYRLPSLALPIFFFSAIGLLSLGLASPLLSNREVVVAGLYWWRWVVYAGLYFVLVDLKSQFKWLKGESLLNFLLGVGVMTAIFGLIQYFLWPNLRPLEELEWDPHYYRVVGTFLDPGFTGIILVLTMILIVEKTLSTFHRWPQIHSPRRSPSRLDSRQARQVGPPSEVEASDELLAPSLFPPFQEMAVYPERSRRANPRSVFRLLSGLVTYLALALTYSRASYLAYIVGIAVVAWLRKLPKLFWGALLIGILTLIILPRPPGEGGKLGRTYSIEARIKNWQHSLVIAKDHPVLGVGFNAYRYAQRDYGFLPQEEWPVSHSGAGGDSSLLFVLATTGILGLMSYLWLWGKAIVGDSCPPPRMADAHLAGVFRQNRRNQKDRGVVLASLAAVFAHSLFLNSLFYPWVMAWVWILLATES